MIRSTLYRRAIAVAFAACVTVGCSGDSSSLDSTSLKSRYSAVAEGLTAAQSAQDSGEFSSASDEYESVLEMDPANRVALFNLGLLRRAQGDFGGSIEAWTQLIEANPDLTIAWYQRALTFRAAGDFESAVEDLRVVIEQEPQNSEAQDQLGSLLVALGEVDEGQLLPSATTETTTPVK